MTRNAPGPTITKLRPELERQALDLAPVMVRDTDGTVRLWTGGMERLYGYTQGEAFGQLCHRLLRTEFPQPLAQINAELLESGRWTGELVHRRRDSAIVYTASQWSLSRNRKGEPVAVTEVSNDVTRQKREEMARLYLAAIVESSDDAIIGKTLDGIVTSWNRGAEVIFGFTAGEMLGGSIALIFPPDRLVEEAAILERMRRGEQLDHYETVRRRKDGTLIDVSLTVSPIRDASGAIIGISKIARDVTERKRAAAHLDQLRSELFHVSRLASMGQMASTLAHELNQPLTAVASYVAGLRRLAADGMTDAQLFQQIAGKAIDQATRAAEIVRRLRAFISRGETERRPGDVNEVVREAIDLGLGDVRQHGVEPTLRLAPDLPKVLIDRIQIEQVVVNLVRNAVEALQQSSRRDLRVETSPSEGMVVIRVTDSGPGISPEIADRLFEPFATTKSTGIGVGLSICRQIVGAHGGRLWVEANQPQGAIFSVTLPAADSGDDT
jgi:two-component system sensor kinase FixL